MSKQKLMTLASGYSAEVDGIDEVTWSQLMQRFDDCNINQTWAFGTVASGQRNISHLVLRLDDEIVAMAQVRIKQLPLLGCGVAYVSWGPMWRRAGEEVRGEDFKQAVRALRNEFVCNRGLTLRLFPLAFEDDPLPLGPLLADEGLLPAGKEAGDRTLLMDLTPSLQSLREGLEKNWRRCLKHSENGELEIVEGTGDELVGEFIKIYKEMVSRKMFAGSIDFEHLKEIQAQLPEEQKMTIMLCRSNEGICAGLVSSLMGRVGIDLFAATSNIGTHAYGSYLLRWNLLKKLKEQNISLHNLNGINPEENPGTYRFKRGMAGKSGRDTYYLGKFDANPSLFSHTMIEFGDALRKGQKELKPRLVEIRARMAHAYSQYVWTARQLAASSRVKNADI